ncbi:MAG: zinc ABC transporter substrate-binding protein [Planctomycetia bacterium]|nr:zinc ABC transporter substrate-binding protein [Planctomycetia bacterium]
MPVNRRERPYVTILIGCVLLTICLCALIYAYGRLKILTHNRESAAAQGSCDVLVAVDPLAYLVRRVGGDNVKVTVLTPQGKSPETYAPTPSQLADVANSQLFFTLGLPIEERLLGNIASIAPKATVVDLLQLIQALPNPRHSHETDDDAHDDSDHAHEGALDPHLWTAPENARTMVATICEELIKLDHENEASYRANAEKLDEELQALQLEIADKLANLTSRNFIVFHPAYGYYAREFQLQQLAIEFEGKNPKPRDLQKLVETAKNDKIHALIIQPEFNRSSAQVVADQLGGEIIEHSPLEEDYFANLRALTDAVVASH